MPDLNERQEHALRALAQSPAGLPLADLDGRVVGALERRSFVRRQGDRVRATPAGKQYLASLAGPEATPDETAAPPAPRSQAAAAPEPAEATVTEPDAPPAPEPEAAPEAESDAKPEAPTARLDSPPSPQEAEAEAARAPSAPAPAPPQVEGPSDPATATRVQRVRKAYEIVHGEESVAPGNVDYAMNVALLVADVLQEKGMGARLCGRELWAEFLRATGYHEQKEAQRIVPHAPRSEKPAESEKPVTRGERQAPTEKQAPRGDRQGTRGERPSPRGERKAPRSEKPTPRGDKQAPRGEKKGSEGGPRRPPSREPRPRNRPRRPE